MNRRTSLAPLPLASAVRVTAVLASAVLAAGCGTAASQTAAITSAVKPPSLATSLATPNGTWAVAVMGGSAAAHNNFWQLFVRPTGTSTWRLATPPGVASNGGLVLASLPGSVVAGFRPSQDLSYSPLASTKDNGKSWSPGLLDDGLADSPGALAADPTNGRLLALLTDGTADISAPGGTAWTRLATRRALATSLAGTRCRLASLNSAAFSPSGQPLLGVGCGRPGTAGIFSRTGRTWRLTGPALPAAYAHQVITVLRLTTTGHSTTALLNAGTGPAAHLLAAWSSDGGAHWKLSPPLRLNDATLASASAGPDNSLAITLSGGRAVTISSAAGPWVPLPALPNGTATLAPGSPGGWNALAVDGTRLTVWQAAPGARAWAREQVVKVPVPFGSSG